MVSGPTVLRVGLEAHVQLRTATKLFSPSPWRWDAPPNTLVAAHDRGAPGALPQHPSREAVRLAVRAAKLLNCSVNTRLKFDRKHYFSADLPAGFQITQHRFPLAVKGRICIAEECNSCTVLKEAQSSNCTATAFPKADARMCDSVGIKQVHLENDAAKVCADGTLDYNRSGVPLVEVVCDAMVDTADISGSFNAPNTDDVSERIHKLGSRASKLAQKIATLLTDAHVTSGVMAHGNVRFDANVSAGGHPRAEIKNLASFHDLRCAICAELEAQVARLHQSSSDEEDLYSQSQSVAIQGALDGIADTNDSEIPLPTTEYSSSYTCAFEKESGRVAVSRHKESAREYMYIPEPDLPDLVIEDALLEEERSTRPRMPRDLATQFGITEDQARVLLGCGTDGVFQNVTMSATVKRDVAARFLTNDYPAMVARESISPTPELLAKAVTMYASGAITNSACRAMLRGRDCVQDAALGQAERDLICALYKPRRAPDFYVGQILRAKPDTNLDPHTVRAFVESVLATIHGDDNSKKHDMQ